MKFYPNTKDDLHCFQACLRMILSEYFPSKNFTFKELEKVTGFSKNQLTWDSVGLLWLAKQGFKIKRISDFDYKRFASEGEAYLRWFWRPDIYEYQKSNTDLGVAHKAVKSLLKDSKFVLRKPLLKDIDNALKKGEMVIASVNPKSLDEQNGYGNHMVVILESKKDKIIFHDPGIPPQPSRSVSRSLFKKSLYELVVVSKK